MNRAQRTDAGDYGGGGGASSATARLLPTFRSAVARTQERYAAEEARQVERATEYYLALDEFVQRRRQQQTTPFCSLLSLEEGAAVAKVV